ncbi:Sjoegren syndrome nuclear autoantigen 1 [Gryllus bimaculatus]|nr:Sjoegren syndrome nuclear autoantigen 1 [Gryllus bimaculatus]
MVIHKKTSDFEYSMSVNEMAQQGAILQTYNQELVKCIEELKRKRRSLEEIISTQQEEKIEAEKELERLSAKLNSIVESLSKNIAVKQDYDRTIEEAEAAYTKILESSQVLLTMVKRESACLESTTE